MPVSTGIQLVELLKAGDDVRDDAVQGRLAALFPVTPVLARLTGCIRDPHDLLLKRQQLLSGAWGITVRGLCAGWTEIEGHSRQVST